MPPGARRAPSAGSDGPPASSRHPPPRLASDGASGSRSPRPKPPAPRSWPDAAGARRAADRGRGSRQGPRCSRLPAPDRGRRRAGGRRPVSRRAPARRDGPGGRDRRPPGRAVAGGSPRRLGRGAIRAGRRRRRRLPGAPRRPGSLDGRGRRPCPAGGGDAAARAPAREEDDGLRPAAADPRHRGAGERCVGRDAGDAPAPRPRRRRAARGGGGGARRAAGPTAPRRARRALDRPRTGRDGRRPRGAHLSSLLAPRSFPAPPSSWLSFRPPNRRLPVGTFAPAVPCRSALASARRGGPRVVCWRCGRPTISGRVPEHRARCGPGRYAMANAIELRGLTRWYGKRRGVADLDVAVEEGEVFGFLGPNGAGKTTTIRVLLGLIRPSAGSASVWGLDAWVDSAAVHRRMAHLGSDPGYLGELTGAPDARPRRRPAGPGERGLAVAGRTPRARSHGPGEEAVARQPPEGGGRPGLHGDGAPPRHGRAVHRPGSADAARVPCPRGRGAGRRPDGLPLVAQPDRGGAGLRPGGDHPRGATRQGRHRRRPRRRPHPVGQPRPRRPGRSRDVRPAGSHGPLEHRAGRPPDGPRRRERRSSAAWRSWRSATSRSRRPTSRTSSSATTTARSPAPKGGSAAGPGADSPAEVSR